MRKTVGLNKHELYSSSASLFIGKIFYEPPYCNQWWFLQRVDDNNVVSKLIQTKKVSKTSALFLSVLHTVHLTLLWLWASISVNTSSADSPPTSSPSTSAAWKPMEVRRNYRNYVTCRSSLSRKERQDERTPFILFGLTKKRYMQVKR